MQLLTLSDVEKIIKSTVRETVAQCPPPHIPLIMTKAQVAAYLGKSVSTIDRYMREGLPFRKFDGGYPEFHRPQVDEWVSERFQEIQRKANQTEGQGLRKRNVVRLASA